eukprot:Nk52_evm5s293 gene=Nk52_evmTU5s293
MSSSRFVVFASGAVVGLLVLALSTYWSSKKKSKSGRKQGKGSRNRREERERERLAGQQLSDALNSNRSSGRAGGVREEEDGADGMERSMQDQESQNLLNLLYTIAEDQARKEGYIHRGITCNSCSVSPIRGIRYKCANCVDHDLCESCEAQDRHNKTHVFIKIRIPIPPLANPRSALLPVFYPGGKQNAGGNLAWETLRMLQRDTHFDQVELEALYEQFKSLSTIESGEGGIDKETFEQCLGPLGLEKNLITERIFKFFDQDGDGVINFLELVCGLSVLCKGSQEEKIEYAFKGYDLDNNGFISRHELYKMFKAYFYLSMELVRDVVKALEEEMISNFDDDGGKPVSAVFTAPIPREGDGLSYEKSADNEETLVDLANDLRGRPPLARKTSSMNTTTTFAQHGGEMWPIMEAMSQDAISEMVDNAFKCADLDNDGMISFEEFKLWASTDSTMIAWFEALGSVF